ncbi:MAG: hypothetical protein RSB70_02080 [Clostridium sp.]
MTEEVKVNEGVEEKKLSKIINTESYVALVVIIGFFGLLASKMGLAFMFKTMTGTAHDIVLNTIWFLMAVIVLAGAITALLSEFGVAAILNKIFYPLMKPLFNLPGVVSVGAVTTYLSDNPSIVPLACDKGFLKYLKRYQVPALVNLGTVFGMGLIVTTFMLAQSKPDMPLGMAVLIGNVAALIGGVISVRLMLRASKKVYGPDAEALNGDAEGYDILKFREIRKGTISERVLQSLLDGGKTGVETAMTIIPGVVVICTFVMILAKTAPVGGVYTGAAYEGVGFFPWIGEKLSFILTPLFGFTDPSGVAFPVTSLASVGASLGVIPEMIASGTAGAKDIAVFTAMGICNAGFITVIVGMMEAIGERELVKQAIGAQFIGGLVSGVAANLLYSLYMLI